MLGDFDTYTSMMLEASAITVLQCITLMCNGLKCSLQPQSAASWAGNATGVQP